jgi:hypothetical protein
MDDFRTRLAKFGSDAKAAEGSVKRILRTAFTSCIWVIGADRIPALSGASYTNQPEEDDDPDRPSLFKFGQRYQVTGRSLLLFVLRRRVRTAAGRAKGLGQQPSGSAFRRENDPLRELSRSD